MTANQQTLMTANQQSGDAPLFRWNPTITSKRKRNQNESSDESEGEPGWELVMAN